LKLTAKRGKMSKEVFVIERRKDRSGWLVILAAAAIVTLWKWMLLAGVIVGLCYLVRRAKRAWDANRERIESRNASIAMRADFEHQLSLRGDPVGMYGQYPAATMPFFPEWPKVYHHDGTTSMMVVPNKPIQLDDYNDGLKDWK
jgi:hypothetical protein